MRKPLEKVDLPFKNWVIGCSGINVLVILVVLLLQYNLPPQIPLLYGLAEGEEQLVPRILLILPNLLAIFITLINFGLTLWLKNPFIKKILMVAPLIVTFLAVTTCLEIIFLVGSF